MEHKNSEKTAVLESTGLEGNLENSHDESEKAGGETENTKTGCPEDGVQNTTMPESQEVTADTPSEDKKEAAGIIIEANPEYIPLATAKLDAELNAFTGGQKEKAVSTFVATVMTKFCNDNARFAEVVYKTTRTLSDVCREVMSGTGNQISDFEVYRKAVQSYFPNADIHCYMAINILGAPPTEDEIRRAPTVQAPTPQAYTQKNQTPIAQAPAKEPEYFETIHLEL